MSFRIPLSYQNRMFGYYLNQIGQQQQLLQHIRQRLPEHMAKHARHCLVSKNTLMVYTDSAVWASQLRFYRQTLLADIATLSNGAVQNLQIKVMTETFGATARVRHKTNIPSLATIEMMAQQSASITDQPLQQALQRLNATLKRRTKEG